MTILTSHPRIFTAPSSCMPVHTTRCMRATALSLVKARCGHHGVGEWLSGDGGPANFVLHIHPQPTLSTFLFRTCPALDSFIPDPCHECCCLVHIGPRRAVIITMACGKFYHQLSDTCAAEKVLGPVNHPHQRDSAAAGFELR
jgi:hypothetical protein